MKIDKSLELEGVYAVGSLDALKAGIDKKIYSTSDDLTSRGGSALDALGNIPSISVDQDGKISSAHVGNTSEVRTMVREELDQLLAED